MKFSREPVAWLTFIAMLCQVLIGWLTNHFDTAILSAFATAAAGVVSRQKVTPVAAPNVPPLDH